MPYVMPFISGSIYHNVPVYNNTTACLQFNGQHLQLTYILDLEISDNFIQDEGETVLFSCIEPNKQMH